MSESACVCVLVRVRVCVLMLMRLENGQYSVIPKQKPQTELCVANVLLMCY